MNVVRQTPIQLVLHEGMLKTVMLGALFAAAGGGGLTLWFTDPTTWSGKGGARLIPLIAGLFILVGVALLVLSADRRFEIDRASGTVRLLVQRLAHRTSDEYRLANLQDVALERSPGGARQSTPFYRIVFLTTSGGRVPWTPYSTTEEGTLASCVSAVRAFCGWGSAEAGTAAAAGMSGPAVMPPAGSVSGHPVATSWGCLGAFLAIFLAAGLGMLGSELYRVATWEPVSARVVSTAIKAVRGSEGRRMRPWSATSTPSPALTPNRTPSFRSACRRAWDGRSSCVIGFGPAKS